MSRNQNSKPDFPSELPLVRNWTNQKYPQDSRKVVVSVSSGRSMTCESNDAMRVRIVGEHYNLKLRLSGRF